ncbi:M28 family peptidase [Candidatus Bathyarchaeota archaeon]|nr:M28 family peptidase [Candidatus Bathyarchaeota archaeon]
MIWLSEADKELLKGLEKEISKEELLENWKKLMEFTPSPSGSPQEEKVIQYIRDKLEIYGLKPEILRYDAYISEPRYARLLVLAPERFEVQCTPYRQVGTTTPEGIDGEVIYIDPEHIGKTECEGKIVLADQETSSDWMGLQGALLLKLQEMGVKGLIVIEQDRFMPTVMHQRADFSVSGNPTSDNINIIQRIPAIVHVSNKDGEKLKNIVKKGDMRVHLTSIVETSWKKLPLLVAEIKGSREPEKFLLVNGHVDTPPFSPGSVDNASGDVAMMELARILNKHKEKLRRSIRFAFWTGHEVGRYAGSTWYNDAYWHDIRYNCVGFLNVDSPGTEGATTYRAAPIGEVSELAALSIREATGITVESFRWPTRAGDHSFWGTGIPHASVVSARPKELYDPFVNYSGGGWWWHTPFETLDHGDVNILAMDVKVNLNYIFRVANCPVLPYNFVPYAEEMVKILKDLQDKAGKISSYFNINPVIERAVEFKVLAEELNNHISRVVEERAPEQVISELNRCIMWVSRHVNQVAHSDAEKTEQMSMETFGATPFPRIHGILKLAEMPLPHSDEFKFLQTKLMRQRNFVEDGFHLANQLIKDTLDRLRASR